MEKKRFYPVFIKDNDWINCPLIKKPYEFIEKKTIRNITFQELEIPTSVLNDPKTNIILEQDYNLIARYAYSPCVCQRCCILITFKNREIPMLRVFQKVSQMRNHMRKKKKWA